MVTRGSVYSTDLEKDTPLSLLKSTSTSPRSSLNPVTRISTSAPDTCTSRNGPSNLPSRVTT